MTRCIDVFKNLNVANRGNNMGVSPCCLLPEKPITVIDFVNNGYLKEFRETWEQGVPHPQCSVCEKSEQQFGNSRRISSNHWYRDHNHDNIEVELIRLDYWVGDTCNLRCVICAPHSSSSWKEELRIPIEERKSVVNDIWKDIDLSKIEFVHFNGGEPLLSKEHVRLLEQIPDKSTVHITYNTNATILPSPQLLELWGQFRLVQLDFSIDDIGERFEYQRFPANWEQVTKNLKWFVDNCPVNCMFAVNTTVSILNYSNLDKLKEWMQGNFSTNRVTDPIEFRQQHVLPTSVFSIENAKQHPENYKKFLDECDKRRGTNWRKVFPELI